MTLPRLADPAPEWGLVHADDQVLVVDKPSGCLSVPGRGAAGADNLAARVQRVFADARVVHRLDQATSGLMLFARGLEAQRALSRQFEQRQVHKRYVAVVHGLLAADEVCIDAPLAADWPQRPRQCVDTVHGRPAVTRVRVLARDALQQRTRVELEPVTGRSHQLRVHLLHLGHPIIGDALYGPLPPAADRLLLHAAALGFTHPVSGQALALHAAVPF